MGQIIGCIEGFSAQKYVSSSFDVAVVMRDVSFNRWETFPQPGDEGVITYSEQQKQCVFAPESGEYNLYFGDVSNLGSGAVGYFQKHPSSRLKAAVVDVGPTDDAVQLFMQRLDIVLGVSIPSFWSYASGNTWTCPNESCNESHNGGNYCFMCGTKNPNPTLYDNVHALGWKCPQCGTYNNSNFCKECGAKKPKPDVSDASKGWTCSKCGAFNKSKFCSECGQSFVDN